MSGAAFDFVSSATNSRSGARDPSTKPNSPRPPQDRTPVTLQWPLFRGVEYSARGRASETARIYPAQLVGSDEIFSTFGAP
jgi:hypothetical protein